MPIAGRIEKRVRIPEGIDVTVKEGLVTVASREATLERRFRHPRVVVKRDNDEIVVSCEQPKKREAALVGTFTAHIRNMVIGITDGYECSMRIVYSHFPMKVSVEEDEGVVLIENFLGERHPRFAKIAGDAKISVSGDTVRITGHSKEDVGQSAANIEQATKIRGYDPRVFQDGIYILGKPKVQENE